GYVYFRPDNHQAYKDAVTGFSINSKDYEFQILDPKRMITIPIRNITAPPNWPAPADDKTRTYTWIDKTSPQRSALSCTLAGRRGAASAAPRFASASLFSSPPRS